MNINISEIALELGKKAARLISDKLNEIIKRKVKPVW